MNSSENRQTRIDQKIVQLLVDKFSNLQLNFFAIDQRQIQIQRNGDFQSNVVTARKYKSLMADFFIPKISKISRIYTNHVQL